MTLGKSHPIYAVPETGKGVRRTLWVVRCKALLVLWNNVFRT
jgi:hypothetical protein